MPLGVDGLVMRLMIGCSGEVTASVNAALGVGAGSDEYEGAIPAANCCCVDGINGSGLENCGDKGSKILGSGWTQTGPRLRSCG